MGHSFCLRNYSAWKAKWRIGDHKTYLRDRCLETTVGSGWTCLSHCSISPLADWPNPINEVNDTRVYEDALNAQWLIIEAQSRRASILPIPPAPQPRIRTARTHPSSESSSARAGPSIQASGHRPGQRAAEPTPAVAPRTRLPHSPGWHREQRQRFATLIAKRLQELLLESFALKQCARHSSQEPLPQCWANQLRKARTMPPPSRPSPQSPFSLLPSISAHSKSSTACCRIQTYDSQSRTNP